MRQGNSTGAGQARAGMLGLRCSMSFGVVRLYYKEGLDGLEDMLQKQVMEAKHGIFGGSLASGT